MKQKFVLILLLCFSFCFAQENNSNEFPKIKLRFESNELNKDNYEYEKIIYLDSTPKMSYEFKLNKRTMLVAFFTEGRPNVIGLYTNFADTWQPVHQKILDYGILGGIEEGLKFYNKEDSNFVYFEAFIPGGSSGNGDYSFALYDIMKNEVYILNYSGYINWDVNYPQIMDGKFEFNNLLDHPEVLRILEIEAAQSKAIKRN